MVQRYMGKNIYPQPEQGRTAWRERLQWDMRMHRTRSLAQSVSAVWSLGKETTLRIPKYSMVPYLASQTQPLPDAVTPFCETIGRLFI